ncbi:hypothetical protein EV198_2279 [Roseivirga ehrenbergii]|uniref:Glycosyltransferase RgtA/B/C/D-like domain-containing protein n=1 Tax=Roseivirga ehrenbergii (strain DSM 102268 / JCM 13514 / KCTC 12282 / NCIMB 14502 / KMM 6017) TaxID=279360 RepID=A0A150XPA8_ROSEK|nr:hypothetical protein [Roseivirga ehrenbergii]KYG80597.1 hypothetical protein MB14_15735 [Roseivirga ehrenbergii]TCL07844.1 hypothetical protein EV198_2279 [Roseivirga ehrenbergii]
MNIPYTDSIFIGLIRLFLWILFLYVMKRLFFKGKGSKNQINSMAGMWSFFASVIVIGIFLLVQINSYDLMTCLFIMVIFFGVRLVGIQYVLSDSVQFRRQRKMILLDVIEKVEDKEPLIDIVEEKPTKRLSVNFGFVIMALTGFVAMTVRFYLLKYDNYQLSESWFSELAILKEISQQNWLSNDTGVVGQHALMTFYEKMTGISPEITLESFGILQAFILSFIIFWFMNVMTGSKVTVPLMATLSFAFFFNLVPINLSQITHGKETLMALTLVLPAMVYIYKPWLLYARSPRTYTSKIFVIFTAIALIDIYALIVLIPPFFLVAPFFISKNYRRFYWRALKSYLLATGLVFGIYALHFYREGIDFLQFIVSNLLSVTSSTYTSNMVLPYDQLISIVQITSVAIVVVMLLMLKNKKDKWASLIAFVIYVNALILISSFNFRYLDQDLFNEVLPVFISIILGIAIYLVMYSFVTKVKKVFMPEAIAVVFIFILFATGAFYGQKNLFGNEEPTSRLSKNVIAAYQEISSSYLPYSYAVVNSGTFQPLSTNSHNFINYRDFLGEYTVRDSVYFANKEDKEFLRANTQYIIPNSLLVFIYNTTSEDGFNRLAINLNLTDEVMVSMEKLKSEGRTIRVFFEKEDLTVYEIVNNPGEARIKELL